MQKEAITKATRRRLKILSPYLNSDGYYKIKLCDKNGVGDKNFFIHRLVATTFIENKDNKPHM